MVDFAKQRIRSTIEAKLLDASAGQTHARFGDRKAAAIGAMSGTVVELGPGTGANMRYYAPGTRVIAIEPNPAMHAGLRQRADEHGVDLEIRTLRGEAIDVDDGTTNGVVGTLLLCGVDDPGRVIAEAHRVLVDGGTYFFIEHVRAPEGTRTRRIQRLVKRPHRWMLNGCEVDRQTENLLRSGPFSRVEVDTIDLGRKGLWVRQQIVGTAFK